MTAGKLIKGFSFPTIPASALLAREAIRRNPIHKDLKRLLRYGMSAIKGSLPRPPIAPSDPVLTLKVFDEPFSLGTSVNVLE
jgi:hypothetical protein